MDATDATFLHLLYEFAAGSTAVPFFADQIGDRMGLGADELRECVRRLEAAGLVSAWWFPRRAPLVRLTEAGALAARGIDKGDGQPHGPRGTRLPLRCGDLQ